MKISTIKSRIAAIDKRIGALPILVTLTIEKSDGSRELRSLDPINAMIKIIDAHALETARPEIKFDRIVDVTLPGDYDEESGGAPSLAMKAFRGLQKFRQGGAE